MNESPFVFVQRVRHKNLATKDQKLIALRAIGGTNYQFDSSTLGTIAAVAPLPLIKTEFEGNLFLVAYFKYSKLELAAFEN